MRVTHCKHEVSSQQQVCMYFVDAIRNVTLTKYLSLPSFIYIVSINGFIRLQPSYDRAIHLVHYAKLPLSELLTQGIR